MKRSLKVFLILVIAVIFAISIVNKSYAQTSSELNIDEIVGVDNTSDGNTNSGNTSSDNTSDGNTSDGNTSSDNTSDGSTSGDSTSSDNTSSDSTSSSASSGNQASSTDNNIADIPEIPTETTTGTPSTETTTETKKAETEKKAEEVEETKLPQTGEAENYLLIVASGVFAGIAVYAYRKNKKYKI